jgi:uncharacterized protein (DUF2342 family)
VLRRLLGVDLKLKQYADGNRFVTAVIKGAGRDGFNRVWESPETLPTKQEVNDPSAWMSRVLGFTETQSAVDTTASA